MTLAAVLRIMNEENGGDDRMPTDPSLKPVSLRRDGDRLVIQWSDGLTGSVTWKALRYACPCAGCR